MQWAYPSRNPLLQGEVRGALCNLDTSRSVRGGPSSSGGSTGGSASSLRTMIMAGGATSSSPLSVLSSSPQPAMINLRFDGIFLVEALDVEEEVAQDGRTLLSFRLLGRVII